MRVVGDDTESGIGCVLLHDATQSHLCRVCHGVGLVQDDQLVGSQAIAATPPCASHGEYLLGRCEGLDLLAHDVNATVVGGVQLQDHLSHVVGAIDAAGERKNRRGLSCTRGTVQKEVREAIGVDELVDCGEDVLVARDVGEGCWTVFLDPESVRVSDSSRNCTLYRVLLRDLTHHGKLSSASTGKLAALRLPLAVLSEENVMSLEGAGTSTSISSSKSDILDAGWLVSRA